MEKRLFTIGRILSPLLAVIAPHFGSREIFLAALLGIVLPTKPVSIAYQGLFTDDRALRGTSLEYLESVLPEDIRVRLWPFLNVSVAQLAWTGIVQGVGCGLMWVPQLPGIYLF